MAITVFEGEFLPNRFPLVVGFCVFFATLLGRTILFSKKPTDGFPLLHPELSSRQRRSKWLTDASTMLREGCDKVILGPLYRDTISLTDILVSRPSLGG